MTVFLIAPLIWLTAMQVPAIAADINLRVVVVSAMQCMLVGLMAYEFWRDRAEALLSRWPAIILLVTHMSILIGRGIVVMSTPIMSHNDIVRSPIFAVMAFGTVLYTITFAFLLLSMTKERTEMRHKIAALVDPLTGLPNRRAFMIDAEAAIARRSSRSEPIAVLLADLDRFKTINDVYGHAIGDRVLQVFAARRCTAASARTISPGASAARSSRSCCRQRARRPRSRSPSASALRLRRCRARDRRPRGRATVSIGVAASRIGGHDLGGLLGRADSALYQAKEAGRNRVAACAATARPSTRRSSRRRPHAVPARDKRVSRSMAHRPGGVSANERSAVSE